MSLNEATLTIKLGDYKALDRELTQLRAENLQLKKDLETAKIDGGGDELTRQCLEAFMGAMPVVRFAVGNMDPMSFRGWPHRDLDTIVAALKSLPGVDGDQKETANDLGLFARECREWEKARANGTEQARLHEQNAARPPVMPA